MDSIDDSVLEDLFGLMRQASTPAVWSRGVQIARGERVIGVAADPDEIELKVALGRGKVAEVSLYPEDEEWSCTCPDDTRFDICEHAVAAILALRKAREEGKALPAPDRDLGHVRYDLVRSPQGLMLDRYVVQGEAVQPLKLSLILAAAGRGRAPECAIESHDVDAEEALGPRPTRRVSRDRLTKLFRALRRCGDVRLDGEPVKVSTEPVVPWGLVEEKAEGFHLSIHPDPRIEEIFANGAALVGGTLRPIGEAGLSRERIRELSRGIDYGPREIPQLITVDLPELEKHIRVQVRAPRLPGVSSEPPRVLVTTSTHDDRLMVQAQIVYGGEDEDAEDDTEIDARVVGGDLVITGRSVPIRDVEQEERLERAVKRVLGLVPGVPALLDGEEAVAFAGKLRQWRGEIAGEAHHDFRMAPPMVAGLEMAGDDFEVTFTSPEGPADPARVLSAWQRGSSLAPLNDGGWAPIPRDWLNKHGRMVADLLDARDAEGRLPRAALPDLARLAQALDQPMPPALAGLEALIEGFEGLPAATLPDDLTATLRSYQRQGVDWLAFLREARLGALLADDMGLGKTLQALTVVRGRTLVVAPTSVLHNWRVEAEKFRPSLRVQVYHGPRRELDPEADLVLTTYGVLRMDVDKLSEQWEMVVLDEAQAIKNPDSLVAQAAFRLNADFRVTLTGTPVENRLDELWSQFHFINRGLLGGRQGFQERYAKPIAEGMAGAAAGLRERIKPFVLRRLKREVAKELPPRTDVVLRAQLSERERAAYDAVKLATRKEIVERLGAGGSNVMKALEALLRLRQAACHTGLLPGNEAETTSSKVELLLEILDEAVSEGHKALVFSQWTSLLDLTEPHLREAGIPFVRLDGSTRDRQAVVDTFQSEEGPPVMLISLKAGGTGLNLTAADHVFMLDPWWNPAVEDQAADRAHRIGQERPVVVHRLVAEDTVEERILALQEAKRALADAALGQADRATGLTRDDLMMLLA